MELLKILKAGDPRLKEIAEPVEKIDKRIIRLLNNMVETMYAADGAGLAAPQVGELKRIVVIDIGDGKLFEMINPVITKRKGSCVDEEGCLSVPDFNGDVERASYIECEYTNRKGKRMFLMADDILARTIQHELDHLDGVLFIDRAMSLVPKVKVC